MILISGILETISSLKDRTIKLTFALNELTPEMVGLIWPMLNNFCYMGLKVEPFKRDEEEMLDGLKADLEIKGKTPGQRLRGVLYRNWEQKNEGFKTFTQYYDSKMEILIEHFKEKLD